MQSSILNLLLEQQRQLGLSYVFISHDLSVVHHMSDRMIVMKSGRIVEAGSKEQGFRAPLAMAVVEEMKTAGVYVFAGGLEEKGPIYSADPTSGQMLITDGPYVETKEWLGGFALIEVADDETAKVWAGKIAEACGWPHEVRRFKPQPD